MEINFFKPKNQLLSKYIEGYYFLRTEDVDNQFSYYTFPNNFQIISCVNQCKIEVGNDFVNAFFDDSGEVISNYTFNYSKPILIQYSGQISEITLYLKPICLNFFVPNLDIYHDKEESFKSFQPFDNYLDEMKKVLLTDNLEEARGQLEEFWLDKLDENSFENLIKFKELIENKNNKSVQEIAEDLNLSRQYLHRISKKYLGKSLVEYKKIQRFRNSLEHKSSSLTDKALENLFYDQSHFTKDIQKMTDHAPKYFFANIDFKTNNPWLII